MTNTEKPSPIEVWLRQDNLLMTCTVVHEDESTHEMDVNALSMRGAQREMTGWFIDQGYTPVGRWETEAHDAGIGAIEASRKFKTGSHV